MPNSRVVRSTSITPPRIRRVNIGANISGGDIFGILNSIHASLVRIESLVNRNVSLQQRQSDVERRNRITQTRTQAEKQAETPKLTNPLIFLEGSLPRTGFLDSIRNFILYTFMGFAFTKLVRFMPQILGTLKLLDPFIKFTETFVGSVFKNFVNAIDFGYDQYDKVRKLAKDVGGQKFEKQFDDLSANLNKFLNLAIIVGFAIAGSGAVGGGGTKKLPTRVQPGRGGAAGSGSTRLSQYFNQTRAQQSITRRYGFDAARFYQYRINRGNTPGQALRQVQSRFQPRAIPTGGLAGGGRTPGSIGARGLGRIQQRAALKILGKGGAKILGKVPIIGPIADFLISTLIFKERPDRAAAGAVGSAVGAALGSFPALIPFGGPIWGGILGDIVGRSLYDTVASVKGEKIQKKATGGQVTRGGRTVGGRVKRTISRPTKRLQKSRSQPPQPGKDVGGIKQITKVFASPKDPTKKNPLRSLQKISEVLNRNRDPLFGGIMVATSNLPLGQKPDPSLRLEIRNNFAALIDNAIAAQSTKEVNQIGRSIFAAAEGGVVPVSRTLKTGPTIGQQLGEAISMSFQNALNSRTNEIFQTLRREMGLKGEEVTDSITGQLPPGEDLTGIIPGMEVVGFVGKTGRSTGPHIHIETGEGRGVGAGGIIPEEVLKNIIVGGKSLLKSSRGDGLGADRGHKGFDYPFDEGTPIQLKGNLRFIEYSSGYNAGYGNLIVIQDSAGRKYLLGHLKSGPANPTKIQQLRQRQQQENLRQMRPTGNTISGQASWYGPGFQRNKTASGERFDTNKMTAAMYRPGWNGSNPFWVEVTNTDNGKKVRVRVNDTGPFAMDSSGRALQPLQPHPTRVIDLSKAAMNKLGGSGVINVSVQKLGAAARTASSTPDNTPPSPQPPQQPGSQLPSSPPQPPRPKTVTIGGMPWTQRSDGSWTNLVGNPISNAELNQMILEERNKNKPKPKEERPWWDVFGPKSNVNIPSQSPSSSIAKAQFTPLPINVPDVGRDDMTSNTEVITNTNIMFVPITKTA